MAPFYHLGMGLGGKKGERKSKKERSCVWSPVRDQPRGGCERKKKSVPNFLGASEREPGLNKEEESKSVQGLELGGGEKMRPKGGGACGKLLNEEGDSGGNGGRVQRVETSKGNGQGEGEKKVIVFLCTG